MLYKTNMITKLENNGITIIPESKEDKEIILDLKKNHKIELDGYSIKIFKEPEDKNSMHA